MKKSLFVVSLFVFSFTLGKAQNFVSSTFLTSYDLEYFTGELEIAFSNTGVDLYRIKYTTKDLTGAIDTASGLVCVPNIDGFNFPLVSYGHGTVASRYDVPSYLSEEHILPAIYSSIGTVCIAPDYLGLGDNEGIHPYVHADSEASASLDLIFAVEEFLNQELNVSLNDQLFITGYSQGGHAAMALHRLVESQTFINVTGAMPMSGPYSISTAMRDLLVSEEEYQYVSYIAATSISYQEVYGNIFPDNDIYQFFKAPYADLIVQYVNEEIDLIELNSALIDALVMNEGGSFPKKMLLDDMLNAILTEDDHPVNEALRDNDVYDWAPISDTRLIYCMADDQVSFENSIIARNKMISNGAQQVFSVDVNSDFNHTQCVTPAATTFVFYLLVNSAPTGNIDLTSTSFTIYPNPTQNGFTIDYEGDNTHFDVALYNAVGERVVYSKNVSPGAYIDLDVEKGVYFILVKNDIGSVVYKSKLMVVE